MQLVNIGEIRELAGVEWDVCIVGSGPAGVALAAELSGHGRRILILESGGLARQDFADALDEIESVGWPRMEEQWLVRNRVVGGASYTWSGRCVPFDEIDYAERPWVPESGWPVTSAEISPYLDRAAPYLGIGIGSGYNDEGFWKIAQRPRPVPMFDAAKLRSYYWTFSRDPDNAREHMRMGNHLPRWAGDDVTLVTNATVCAIGANEDATLAKTLDIAAPDGARTTLAARIIVLCAGGIETPRLLLNSCDVVPDGLGNAHGQVGRYLMDHLRGPVARFALTGTAALRRQFGHYRIASGQVFVHGMQMSEQVQRDERLLNATAWLEGRITADDPYFALKRWARLKPELPGDAVNVLRNISLLARGARDYFVRRNGLPRKIEHLFLVAMCEQCPDAQSRITLSDQRDCFGVRRARLDWRVHDQEVQTLRRMTQLVSEEFARLGLGLPEEDAWVRDNGALPSNFRDVAHPTGTTRMGRDPARAVVDENGRVHGMQNLYIAGSAVFPTSSHANPTQMIVAMAIRLGDELKRCFSGNMNIRQDIAASV